jgi:stage V sporulation protein R
MKKSELKRLIKIENRIKQIAEEDFKLKFFPVEFDIVPPQKMLEIMAYHIPTNISNWKRGREYERQRTIYENADAGLPYEVVINSNPARAYLMNSNVFAVQCLVMSHVIGHVAFFTNNKYFRKSRQDIMQIMYEATHRFNEYERRFSIDEVEFIVDAGHALQFHSSPFASRKTEDEKRERIFKQEKKRLHAHKSDGYGDISGSSKKKINEDIELFNQKLWRKLKLKTPVEPTEDILRYVIDNSSILESWQKDILEVLRIEGQYFWPIIKTKYMNEGFAVTIHQKIMNKLFEEDLLTTEEHAQYNYSNSLVKAHNPVMLNPYTVGTGVWKDIEERWNKGRHGNDWENCTDVKEKEKWDTKEMNGWNKCLEIVDTYTDWFFMQDFLTAELVDEMNLYIYKKEDKNTYIDYVRTKHKAEEIRKLIIESFGHNQIPIIEVINGNYDKKGEIALKHKWGGIELDKKYGEKTMEHIFKLYGRPVHLSTIIDKKEVVLTIPEEPLSLEKEEEDLDLMDPFGNLAYFYVPVAGGRF